MHQRQDALGGLHTCGVGHRVGGFQHLDALRQTGQSGRRVVVAGDHHARHGRIGRPQLLERLRHGTGGFAGSNHHGATARHGGQHGRQVQERLGPRHGGGKKLAQKIAWLLLGGDKGVHAESLRRDSSSAVWGRFPSGRTLERTP